MAAPKGEGTRIRIKVRKRNAFKKKKKKKKFKLVKMYSVKEYNLSSGLGSEIMLTSVQRGAEREKETE